MKRSKEKRSGKEELFQLTKINDVSDVFLFFIGLFIPVGDLFESMVGGAFDILLLIWIFPILRNKIIWVFLIESLDGLDLFFVTAKFEVIGFIEVIPSWWWVYNNWVMKGDYYSIKKIPSLYDPINIPPKIRTCPICEEEISLENEICEYCGTDLEKIKT